MKRICRSLIAIIGMLLLVGCTIPGLQPLDYDDYGGQSANLIDASADPVKTQGDEEPGTDPAVDGVGPTEGAPTVTYDTLYCYVEKVSVPDDAMEYAIVRGMDEDNNVLWEYETPKQYVGQYDGITEMYYQGDYDFYLYANYSVYCFDMSLGEPRWICEVPDKLTGVTFAFDDNQTLYLMGPETTKIYEVDLGGHLSTAVEKITFSNGDAWWPYYMEIVDGYAVIWFDSDSENARTINLENGCEEMPFIDISCLMGEWEQISFEVEGYVEEGEEISSFYSFNIDERGYVTMIYEPKYSDDLPVKYEDMPATVCLGDIYPSFEASENGRWYVKFAASEDVYFMAELNSDDELEVIYYHDWSEDEYPSVATIKYKRVK